MKHSTDIGSLALSLAAFALVTATAFGGDRPIIAAIGYWPPSNEMLRRFSPNPDQNPQGWVGENWEGRGYDVYTFFPEFNPPDCDNCGKGVGDFEVDYQDTSEDFWPIIGALQPVAVLSFGRGYPNTNWEIEMNQYNRDLWGNDYQAPYQPTPCPPDETMPADWLRQSMLPVEEIADAINDAGIGVYSYVDWNGDGGGFVCEFAAYHDVWYQDLHSDPGDPAWCVTAGHIHVGKEIEWDTARQAAEITFRTVIGHVDSILYEPGDVNHDGVVNTADLLALLGAWGDCPEPPDPCPADFDDNGVVNTADLLILLGNWG